MKIFGFAILGLFTSVFSNVDVYSHPESTQYISMSRDERHDVFVLSMQPVVYLNRASKIRRNARPRNFRNEWEPILFYFNYFCPIMDLDLREVIVKFEGFDPVYLQGTQLNVHNMLKSNSQVVSRWEGRIFFRIDGIETEDYIKSKLEYVRFVSDDNSPCKMDIKLERFEKDSIFVWPT